MIVTASTLHAATPRLAELLDTYTPNSQPADDRHVLRLTNPDGYTIGARSRLDGTTLQLWIAAPGTRAEKIPRGLQPLQPGRSYHTVLQLAGLDGDLGDTIYAAVADRLLPAIAMKPRYIGHRPWERHPNQAPAAANPEGTDTKPAEAHAAAEPDTPAQPDPPVEPDTAAEPQPPANPTEPNVPTTPPAPAPPAEDSSADPATTGASAPKARPVRKRAATKKTEPAATKPPRTRKTTPAADSKTRTRTGAKKTATPAAGTATRNETPTKPTRARKTAAAPAKPRTRATAETA
ncbi:hypothetical protein [Kitasatospora cineracea]|uniref:hypothetical protein n=1 Tax=Kitasatospora cineracea TaxID=88074 RepID=UPI0034115570